MRVSKCKSSVMVAITFQTKKKLEKLIKEHRVSTHNANGIDEDEIGELTVSAAAPVVV